MNHFESFLSLVRLGIGHSTSILNHAIKWQVIQTLAQQQGLLAVVLDGVNCLSEKQRPDKELLLQWIGEVLQDYEYRYGLYRRTISEIADFYNEHGFKMMVLKGYACSLDWPKPGHRPCGDIDIWLFGWQKEADVALASCSKLRDLGIKIDNSHHHHSVFNWGEFTVENHFDFVNVYVHKSSRELEKIFKELGQDDSHFVEVNGEKVYLPSPNLHALFLIRHMISHFAATEISLRQVLDWAFFVEKHTKEIDWEWLVGLLEKYHMTDFYNNINAICVNDLGFPVNMFPQVQFEPSMKERVLNDILAPAFTAEEPCELLNRLEYKLKRWQGNAWKHDMCYGESRWSAFWLKIWAKIMKPKTI